MHIGLKIKELAVIKNLTVPEMAKALGKTKQALYEMIDREDVSTKVIKQLTVLYGVPASFFFDEEPASVAQRGSQNNVNGDNNIGQSADTPALLAQIEEKDRQIATLLAIIDKFSK